MKKHLLGVALITGLAATASAQVVINEFSYDDAGADDEEFVELYNTSASPVDISGWDLVAYNGSDGLSYITATIPAATSIPANGFYVFTFTGVLLSAFPSGFVANQAVTGNPQNGDAEGLVLRDAGDVIVDAVAYDCATGVISLNTTDFPASTRLFGNWNGTGATRTASAYDYSIGRVSDGLTGNAAEVFTKFAASPGTTNNTPPFATAMPYTQNWNLTVAATDPQFWGRFTDPRAADPVAGSGGQIPGASPGGGNSGFYCDPTGGGESSHFNMAPLGDFQFEAYVYLESTVNATAGQNYAFDIGIGCTDENFSYTTAASYGTSGLYWAYRNNGATAGATLELRESLGPIVASRLIGSVPLSSNGWQRVFLRRQGSNVLGIVGGTYGSTVDGTQLTDSSASTTAKGVFFTGYREVLTTNNKWLWIDDVSLSVPSASVSDWTMISD